MLKITFLLFSLFILFSPLSAQNNAAGLDWFMNGEQKRKQARFEAAITDFKIAILREPNNIRYHYSKALCEHSLQKLEEAVASLHKIIALEKTYTQAYVLLAKIYHEQKLYEKAYKMYDAAAYLESNLKESFLYKKYVVDFLVQRANYSLAFEKIEEVHDLISSDNGMILLYMTICNELQKYDETISFFKSTEANLKILAENQISPYWYALGMAYYQKKQFADAFTTWEKVSTTALKYKIEPYLPIYFEKCALAYSDLDEYEEAMFFVEKLKKTSPESAVIFFILGKLEIHKLDLAPALNFYLQAARYEKDFARSVVTYRRISDIELEMSNFQNALVAAEKGLSLAPKDEALLFAKARAHYKLKQYENAIQTLILLNQSSKDEQSKSKYALLSAKSAIFLADTKKAKTFLAQVTHGNYKVAANYEMRLLNKEL